MRSSTDFAVRTAHNLFVPKNESCHRALIRWMRGLLVGLITIILASCTGFEQRRGPRPILDATSVQAASINTNLIIEALSRDARTQPDGTVDYYLVALAGFNYIDDQCRSYFDDLFFLDRGREQAKTGLAAAGQTTAAILGVTGASATSLAVVAQAFGFGISATDVVAGTYLYGLPPAATRGFVEKLQFTFRDGVALRRAAINSVPTAYYVIQRYLELCLPPRIEAEITKQISSAGAVGVKRGSGALFSLETVSVPARSSLLIDPPSGVVGPNRPSTGFGLGPGRRPPVRRESSVIGGPRDPIRERPARQSNLPTRLTNYEQSLDESEIKEVQRSVCVKPTGDLGPENSPTRRAIADYLVGRGEAPNQKIENRVSNLLRQAAEKVPVSCEASGFANAIDVGRSFLKP